MIQEPCDHSTTALAENQLTSFQKAVCLREFNKGPPCLFACDCLIVSTVLPLSLGLFQYIMQLVEGTGPPVCLGSQLCVHMCAHLCECVSWSNRNVLFCSLHIHPLRKKNFVFMIKLCLFQFWITLISWMNPKTCCKQVLLPYQGLPLYSPPTPSVQSKSSHPRLHLLVCHTLRLLHHPNSKNPPVLYLQVQSLPNRTHSCHLHSMEEWVQSLS